MSKKLFPAFALVLATVGLSHTTTAQAEDEYYFYVKNASKSRISKIEVAENKRSWGSFDIGKGIAAGRTVRLVWDASTNDEDCNQWIRATFADGSQSEPAKFDFCQGMDDPIVFEE